MDMTLTIEVAFVLLCVIGFQEYLLRQEKKRATLQREHYFWMAAAAELYLFDYDARRDDMRLSEACAYLLGLPEHIPEFSHAERSGRRKVSPEGMLKLHQAMQSNQRGQELAITRQDGVKKFYRISSRRFNDYGDYKLSRIMGIFADVTADVVKEQRLAQKASLDQLTGAYNRGAIHQLVEQELHAQQEAEQRGAFLMLDIDHFKEINDSSGHQAGDAILCGLTDILRHYTRTGDYVGRMGGDEFCVFLRNIPSREAATHFCERIRAAVPQKLSFGQEHRPATISIGCTLTKNYDSFDVLYARADKSLYQAKQSGRNQFVLDAF